MIYKRGTGKKKWYWMDNTVNGVRYREPLKTRNWQEALRREKERLAEIAQGRAGPRGATARQTLSQAIDSYIEERQLHSAEKTCRTDRERSRPLREFFGETPIRKIAADTIVKYQTQRKETGVCGRTINLEVGLLRRVLKKFKGWARIADDVHMLREEAKPAQVLLPEEKAHLLGVLQTRPEWENAYCSATLALQTTMRGCELRGLLWGDVDLIEKKLTIRRESTKTNAGARVIPLNRDAMAALVRLRQRASQHSEVQLGDFVFPACEDGKINPAKPMKGWRTAWRSGTKAAGLKGLRFHDLRHQAITELAENGLSDQTVMSIAGHVSTKMLNHYSHIRLESKRKAVEVLETLPPAETPTEDQTPRKAN